MMKLAYFGKKRPKKVDLPVGPGEKVEHYEFEPFKETEVSDEAGKILLDNAGDIFKRTDKDERKPADPVKPSTEGYVGDVHAAEIPDLEKRKAADKKKEEGKDIEEVIAEGEKKSTGKGKAAGKGKGKAGK